MTSGTLYRVREGLPDEVIGEIVRYDVKLKDQFLKLGRTLPAPGFFVPLNFQFNGKHLRAGLKAMSAAFRGRRGAAAYWRRRLRRLER